MKAKKLKESSKRCQYNENNFKSSNPNILSFSNVWYGTINQTTIQGCENGIVLTDCEYITVDGNGGVKIRGSPEVITGILLIRCRTVSIKNFIIRDFN